MDVTVAHTGLMKILITGICGFVGSTLARTLLELCEGLSVCGMDNLMRPGSESNRGLLRRLGVSLFHGDIRMASDFEALPQVDWVIDAAANPSVSAGVSAGLSADVSGGVNSVVSSRQVLEHNLTSLVNVLEYAKARGAGLILLSSSRVFSIPVLAGLPLRIEDRAFRLDDGQPLPQGVSTCGINAEFSTQAPVSLYGSTKLASETVALDFGLAFGLPVWINRCGVLAGAGQFGTPDQGIFSYWIHARLRRRPLRYIGFEGHGYQVRDAFHPRDLAGLLFSQMRTARVGGQRIYTAGGGPSNAMSLAQLTAWCDARWCDARWADAHWCDAHWRDARTGPHAPQPDLRPRPYDIPWMIMDSHDARRDFGWSPALPLTQVLDEIAAHAERSPEWLELSGI